MTDQEKKIDQLEASLTASQKRAHDLQQTSWKWMKRATDAENECRELRRQIAFAKRR